MARASGSYPEGRWFDSTRRYHYGRLAQLGEHLPYKQRVIGSSPIAPTICGPVVQLVRMPACHAGGRRFEPVPGRQFFRNLRGTLYCVNKYAKIEIAKAEHINLTVNCIILAKVNRLYGGYRQVVKTQGCGSCIRGFESHYPPQFITVAARNDGVSPSGKAMDSDSIMRRFESCYPSQRKGSKQMLRVFCYFKGNPIMEVRVLQITRTDSLADSGKILALLKRLC